VNSIGAPAVSREDSWSYLTDLTRLTYHPDMTEPLVPTIGFSPAKAHLSDVMDAVFHQHRLQLVSRHRGKEKMLLVRPEDLVAMLGDQRLEVLAVYDEGEVTLRVPELGVLGFGDTLDEAIDDVLAELRVYVARFFDNPSRYLVGRGVPPLSLLRFALSGEDEQRSVLGIDEPAAERALVGAS
jgi:hypothetical protein